MAAHQMLIEKIAMTNPNAEDVAGRAAAKEATKRPLQRVWTVHTTPNEDNDEHASSLAGRADDEETDTDEEKPRCRRRRRGGRRRGSKDEQILDATDDSPPSPNSISSGSPAADVRSGERVAKVENETDSQSPSRPQAI